MMHVGDNYHNQIIQNRVVQDLKVQQKFEAIKEIKHHNREVMQTKVPKIIAKKAF